MRLGVDRGTHLGQRTACRAKQAGHTTAIAQGQIFSPSTLASRGPSTHEGVAQVLADVAEDTELPTPAKEALALLGREIGRLDARLAEIEARLVAQHKQTPTSKMLAEVPGIGPIGALSLVLRVDFTQFKSGRHFASWLGLTPREHSTGGKTRLGGISRAGDERLRQLLVLGATAVIRRAKPGKASPWLIGLLARRPRKLAAVALANKMARIVWAMMTSGEAYRRPATA